VNTHDFLGQVQARAHLSDTDQSLAATRATLVTLAQRIDPGERSDLAAQLPGEIGRMVGEVEGQATYGLHEFYQRVSQEEGAGLPAATHHARMVMTVVEDAVSAGEIADVREQLPAEYAELFTRAD